MTEMNVVYQSGETVPVAGIYQLVAYADEKHITLTKGFAKADRFSYNQGLPASWFLIVANAEGGEHVQSEMIILSYDTV